MELSIAYGCEKNLNHSTLLQYIHQNRHHNGRRIDTIGNFLFNFLSSSKPFAGKVVENLKTELREEVADLKQHEQEMEEAYEAKVKALEEKILSQEANLATNEANAKAFEAKVTKEEQQQATKIANIGQGVATNAANTKALEENLIDFRVLVANKIQTNEDNIASTGCLSNFNIALNLLFFTGVVLKLVFVFPGAGLYNLKNKVQTNKDSIASAG